MAKQDYRRIHSEEDGEETPSQDFGSRYWVYASFARHSIINVVVFAFGILLGVFLTKSRSSGVGDHYSQYSLVPSPAFEAISTDPLRLSHHDLEGHGHASPYQGFPTPETTAKWMELMDGYSIRVPSTSLDTLNLKSIPLNDDSGDVWVSMNVYHHLHCLDSIRHQVAGVQCAKPQGSLDQYFPPHIDHCIETLRRRLICQPDLGVRAIAWNPEKAGVAFANNTVDSACVNWDAIQDWTKRHSFTEEDKLVTRPDGQIYIGPRTPPARCGQ
ncbi:hypothetical protein IQ06DRAFT_38198 [Phaeosphaeriaceae sp. SRC1lsM3a]|nr:hypothetical protein IQ06DRAFT_38198 [Stagonospora sp. SRC1lsM3a]